VDNEVRKIVCPHCGGETKCFSSRVTGDFLLQDEYLLWCSVCSKQKAKRQPAGRRIANRDYPQRTICPFCGRPPSEHRQGLSTGEICRLIHERGEEAGSLRTPEDLHKRPAAAGIAPPPRARRITVGTKRTEKPVTSRDIAKLLVYSAPLYAIVLGVSVFIARTSEGTSFTTALYAGLTTAALILVTMVFISTLIIYDFRRRFEKGLRQKE